jgi:hypothetical protein
MSDEKIHGWRLVLVWSALLGATALFWVAVFWVFNLIVEAST